MATLEISYQKTERLIEAIQDLSLARSMVQVIEIVKKAARDLTGADGATFVLREGDSVHYVDEDAIRPLWKGRRFPMQACISGWAILHQEAVAISDIYQDARIPHDAYRPTFVKSLAMIPVRRKNPIAAIGNYWATHHQATEQELKLLQSLADSTSIALENVHLYDEMQKALREAQQASAELSRQLELRDEFISAAAHEFQTPLTPLSIQNQFLEKLIKAGEFKGHAKEEQLKRFAATSRRSLQEMKERVEHLIDVSKIKLNQFAIHPTPNADLGQLIRKAVAECLDESHRIQVRIDSTSQGHWDERRLSQVLRIILSNAIRYGNNQPIQVVASQDQAHAVISVKDEGAGITTADQSRIFDRFERASSILHYGGMGLGLFIAKQIVEAHQGTILVESAKDQGTVFTVRIPSQPSIGV